MVEQEGIFATASASIDLGYEIEALPPGIHEIPPEEIPPDIFD